MDYSAVVDSRAERLNLVETLTENRLQLLNTFHSLHPLMILQLRCFVCYSTVL